MNLKSILKKIVPQSLIDNYHRDLALFANWIYGCPSEKLIVIGVTGTNGKSTTVNLIAKALESNGDKVGATSTVLFKVAGEEWLNDKKMTMVGRFFLQKLLRQMVKAGCKYAVIETSSEGIKQHRHLGINYDYAVFTNLTPEHIESHGGFENYKNAKKQLFYHLATSKRKVFNGGKVEKTTVINIDDDHADEFAEIKADRQSLFSVKGENVSATVAKDVELSMDGTSFTVNGQRIKLKLFGRFNVYNALPAIIIGLEEGIPFEKIKTALEAVPFVPGRMEFINAGQNFRVLVDYAPEPESMRKMYLTVHELQSKFLSVNKIIHVLGSCGGGRDKNRRPILGALAAENADYVIITNEDPYDDDPLEIINWIAEGAISRGKILEKDLFKVIDRREAIKKALLLAGENDLVIITGKGSEQAMAVAGGRYIPWDDRVAVKSLLVEILGNGLV